jgi:hypothetical protein
MLQGHETREDVIALIEGKRLVLDGVQELKFENEEQAHDRGYLYPGPLEQRT